MFSLLILLTISFSVFCMLPTGYTQDLHLVQEQARIDAKEDVGPYSESGRFALGAALGCFGCISGGCAGFGGFGLATSTGSTSSECGLSSFGILAPSEAQMYGCIAGAVLLGGILPRLIMHRSPNTQNPPPKRLLGKSPEYIAAYTQSYQSEMRNLKRKHGNIGVTVGNIGISLGLLLMFLFG